MNNPPKKKKKTFSSAEYLRQLGYSVQENIYQNNQSQSSDLSPAGFQKKFQEYEERKMILKVQFKSISDVEIIEELRERIAKQEIKLSIYPNQDHIFVSASNSNKQVSIPLPITKKNYAPK